MQASEAVNNAGVEEALLREGLVIVEQMPAVAVALVALIVLATISYTMRRVDAKQRTEELMIWREADRVARNDFKDALRETTSTSATALNKLGEDHKAAMDRAAQSMDGAIAAANEMNRRLVEQLASKSP